MSNVLTLPRNLSYSQVSSMQRCGLQWLLERGFKVPQIPSWARVGGSAVHSATEQWDLDAINNGTWDTSLDAAVAYFEAAFENEITETMKNEESPDTSSWRPTGRATKEWPNRKDEAWWRANGPLHVAAWARWRTNSGLEIAFVGDHIGVEVPGEIEVAGVPVRFYVDRVFQAADRSLLAVDIKTGDRAPDDDTQLGVYAYCLEKQYGVRVRWGAYWMGKTGSTGISYDLDTWPAARVEHMFTSTRTMQRLGIFLPKVTNMCSGCGVIDYCAAKGGAKAHEIPLPWEVSVVDPLAA